MENNNTLELVKYIVGSFAEKADEVEYTVEDKDNVTEITVYLAESDMGKVIGKQGKIAKAMRTLVTAATPRNAKRTIVSIKEKA
ncbi:MAG: KH domain-containing protein [Clostridia bacterium]|nr:KH domain-containing protein [Clostridia bacterium]